MPCGEGGGEPLCQTVPSGASTLYTAAAVDSPLKLLIVDEDPNFGRILSSVLGSEGHVVAVLGDSRQGLAALERNRPDVLLVSVDVADTLGLELVTRSRASAAGAQLVIVVMAALVDERLRRVCDEAAVAEIVVRPFSVLDLAARVRGINLPPAASAQVASPGTPLDFDNTTRLVRLWARRASGILQIASPRGEMWVTLADGAPVDAESLAALREVLHGGEVEFQPCNVEGAGDYAATGRIFWEEALASERGRRGAPTRGTLLTPTHLTEAAAQLPLSAGLGRILAGLTAAAPLGRLCDAQLIDAATVVDEVAALAALGMLSLQEAPAMPATVARRPEPQPEGFSTVARRPPGAGVPTGIPLATTRIGSQTHTSEGRSSSGYETRRPASGEFRRPAESGGIGPPAGMRPPMPTAPLPMGRPGPISPARPPPAADEGALIKRLRREVDLLRTSDPWVVLSVPHDAERKLVDIAVERMRTRYSDLGKAQSPELRDLAVQMLARVNEAYSTLTATAAELTRPDEPGDDAFKAGLRAMAAGDWALADRRFVAARDQNLDSVRNIAHVAWARVHNPEHPAAARTSDGLDMLLLAEQLDPNYADGQYFLATVLHRKGDDDGAARRIRRALRAEPGHVAASALARKLRRTGPG